MKRGLLIAVMVGLNHELVVINGHRYNKPFFVFLYDFGNICIFWLRYIFLFFRHLALDIFQASWDSKVD